MDLRLLTNPLSILFIKYRFKLYQVRHHSVLNIIYTKTRFPMSINL